MSDSGAKSAGTTGGTTPVNELDAQWSRLSAALKWKEYLRTKALLQGDAATEKGADDTAASSESTPPSRACLVKPIMGRAMVDWFDNAATNLEFRRALGDIWHAAEEYGWSRSTRANRLRDAFQTIRQYSKGCTEEEKLLAYADGLEHSLTGPSKELSSCSRLVLAQASADYHDYHRLFALPPIAMLVAVSANSLVLGTSIISPENAVILSHTLVFELIARYGFQRSSVETLLEYTQDQLRALSERRERQSTQSDEVADSEVDTVLLSVPDSAMSPESTTDPRGALET